MMYMSSSSSSTGDMTLYVYFEIDADPSLAQVEVQNRVNLALPLLPSSVQAQGVQVKKKSSAMMMVIAIYSPDERYNPSMLPTTRTFTCSMRSSASPARTRQRSWARPTTPCASG